MMVTVAALAAAACTDTWDEHYGNEGGPISDKSLLQLVEEAGDLNDFLKVLQSTHVFNNNKPTGVTYAELLASDQTFTVWAPKDGTFNVDSLLAECATGVRGDSMCGQHFVQNHIAHYVTNSTDTKSTIMLNGKYLASEPGNFEGVGYAAGRSGQPARNGLLHVMSGELPYLYNIYEGLTTLEDYLSIGAFFKRYEELELNEAASIQSGIVDGQIIYSDSVLDRNNILFGTFENISEEDSNFIMLVPDAQIWDRVYDEAKQYFNFGSANKADSLQEYYAHLAVIRDLVYNRNVGCQHMADSVYSTSCDITLADTPGHYEDYVCRVMAMHDEYEDSPYSDTCRVDMSATAISQAKSDNMSPVEVYSLNGVLQATSLEAMKNLPMGVYILRKGKETKKIVID